MAKQRRSTTLLRLYIALSLFGTHVIARILPEGVALEPPSQNLTNFNAPYNYFERTYSTGWFTSAKILDSRLDSAQLFELLTQRRNTHIPEFITAHTSDYPRPTVFFNVLWLPNTNSVNWALVFNLEGPAFQDQLTKHISAGLRPLQIDTYAFGARGSLYYAAVFVPKERWAPGTQFDSVFGVPSDGSYCCGLSSRWSTLQRKGFKPLSIAVVQDPTAHGMYVADGWTSEAVDYWQAALGKTAGEMNTILGALSAPLVPVFLKSYRQTYEFGGYQILYAYIAKAAPALGAVVTTIDISRSGYEFLAKIVTNPPLLVTSFYLEGEADPSDPTSGDMYSVIWCGTAPADRSAISHNAPASMAKKKAHAKASKSEH